MSNQLVSTGIGVVGLLFGSLIGVVGYKACNPPEDTSYYERNCTGTEKAEEDAEQPQLEEEEKTVLEAQAQVKSLQEQLAEKEAELVRMKKQEKQNKSSKAAAQAKWREMEDEIARLQIQLAAAEQERDELKEELKETLGELNETLVKLDKQIKETKKYKAKAKKYKRESTQNLWKAFRAQAKVDGCFRGGKKKHENCHEGFDTALNSDVQLRFNNCVDTYQAVPVLKKLKKGEELPNFSAYLNQDNRFTKNWYIIFCDPTLPEARDLDLDDAPPSKSTKPVFDDDDDLDIDFDALPER